MSKVNKVTKRTNKDNVSANSSNNNNNNNNNSTSTISENRNYWYCGVIFALISVTICAIYPILYSKPQYLKQTKASPIVTEKDSGSSSSSSSSSKTSTSRSRSSSSSTGGNSERLKDKGGWYRDLDFEGLSEDVVCDIPIIHSKDIDPNKIEQFDFKTYPFIVRGLTTKWTANDKWKRSEFSKEFGTKIIQTGSESSIVYGGGTAGMPYKLRTVLDHMEKQSVSGNKVGQGPDVFTFDVGALQSIPELGKDFRVPIFFQDWDNKENEEKGISWHMLSLGPSRTGLPFHVHGETWLALVYGQKRWFLYPPGTGMPPELEKSFNPLRTVEAWFQDIYHQMSDYDIPPTSTWVGMGSKNKNMDNSTDYSKGFKPMECIQQAGDILYLPAGWSHLTMNIGEAIGIGGQTALSAERRLDISRQVLEFNPINFEAHKGVALSLAHQALDVEHKVKQDLLITRSGLVQLREDNFENLILNSEDTWLVQYFGAASESAEAGKFANELASKLAYKLSFGAMNLTSNMKLQSQHMIDEKTLDNGPIFILIKGGSRNNLKDILKESILYKGSHEDMNEIITFCKDTMNEYKLIEGAITGVGVKSARLFEESIRHLRKALTIQPQHPEVLGLLVEVLGYAQRYNDMDNEIKKMENMYDNMDTDGISSYSRASVYHKLGTTFLNAKQDANKAFPLFEKSLNIMPDYIPALVDKAVAYVLLKDGVKAELAVREVEKLIPNHPIVNKIRQQVWAPLMGATGGASNPSKGQPKLLPKGAPKSAADLLMQSKPKPGQSKPKPKPRTSKTFQNQK